MENYVIASIWRANTVRHTVTSMNCLPSIFDCFTFPMWWRKNTNNQWNSFTKHQSASNGNLWIFFFVLYFQNAIQFLATNFTNSKRLWFQTPSKTCLISMQHRKHKPNVGKKIYEFVYVLRNNQTHCQNITIVCVEKHQQLLRNINMAVRPLSFSAHFQTQSWIIWLEFSVPDATNFIR